MGLQKKMNYEQFSKNHQRVKVKSSELCLPSFSEKFLQNQKMVGKSPLISKKELHVDIDFVKEEFKDVYNMLR